MTKELNTRMYLSGALGITTSGVTAAVAAVVTLLAA